MFFEFVGNFSCVSLIVDSIEFLITFLVLSIFLPIFSRFLVFDFLRVYKMVSGNSVLASFYQFSEIFPCNKVT